MLFDSKMPKNLWAEAMNHATWIKNRAPTRALGGITPFEVRYGRPPNLSKVVPFGTPVWVKLVDAGKLAPRACLGHFVGFDRTSTGYRIDFPDKKHVRVEREVVFKPHQESEPIAWIDDEGEKKPNSQHNHQTSESESDYAPNEPEEDPDDANEPKPLENLQLENSRDARSARSENQVATDYSMAERHEKTTSMLF
jgi:hypothetical protein